jgi:hypothetical protein
MGSRDVVDLLEDAGFLHKCRRDLPNNQGKQIILKCGAIVNLYRNGNWLTQGRVTPHQEASLEAILVKARIHKKNH